MTARLLLFLLFFLPALFFRFDLGSRPTLRLVLSAPGFARPRNPSRYTLQEFSIRHSLFIPFLTYILEDNVRWIYIKPLDCYRASVEFITLIIEIIGS